MESVLMEFKTIYNVDDTQLVTLRKILQAALKEHSSFSMERI